MPHNKSPGPNGYSSEFFIAALDIVDSLITSIVKEFFTSGRLLKQMNSTVIALIPKFKHSTKVTEFRPIS